MSADPQTPELDHYNLRFRWFATAVVIAQCAVPLTVLIHPSLFMGAMLLKSILMVGWSIRLAPSEPEGIGDT